jgi:hypothetical protein
MTDVQDLNKLGAPEAEPSAGGAGQIVEKPYDPGRARETIRGTIAQALVWTIVIVIGLVVLAGFVTAVACHAKDACSTDAIELKTIRVMVELVLTPLIGLVGAVTGFYFGEKSTAR